MFCFRKCQFYAYGKQSRWNWALEVLWIKVDVSPHMRFALQWLRQENEGAIQPSESPATGRGGMQRIAIEFTTVPSLRVLEHHQPFQYIPFIASSTTSLTPGDPIAWSYTQSWGCWGQLPTALKEGLIPKQHTRAMSCIPSMSKGPQTKQITYGLR